MPLFATPSTKKFERERANMVLERSWREGEGRLTQSRGWEAFGGVGGRGGKGDIWSQVSYLVAPLFDVNKQVMSDPPPLHQISFLEAFRREKRETVAIVLFDYFIPTHNPRDKKKIHQGYKIKQIISTNFQKFIICRKHLNQVLNATCIIDQRKFLLRPSEWSLAWWNQRAASQTGVIKA